MSLPTEHDARVLLEAARLIFKGDTDKVRQALRDRRDKTDPADPTHQLVGYALMLLGDD